MIFTPANYLLHRETINQIAFSHYETRTFPHEGYSREGNYPWVRVALDGDKVIGFLCYWHMKRKQPLHTVIRFISILPEYTSRGVGKTFITWLKQATPHGVIRLVVSKKNEKAIKFYQREGFCELSAKGTNLMMEWIDPDYSRLPI
jgi:ribosomal protein S18 acetylase RimI-like enzyme